DHVIPWRGALLGGFHWVSDALLQHRMHEGQWRNRLWSGMNRDAKRETVFAQYLSVGRARRRDIDHLLASASEPESARLTAIRSALDARMEGIYEEWLDLRDKLIREGHRPDWQADLSSQSAEAGAAESNWTRMRRFWKQ
ncbi:MAG: hypothetical protein ACREJT_13350, partial [Myxococcota bacterium]